MQGIRAFWTIKNETNFLKCVHTIMREGKSPYYLLGREVCGSPIPQNAILFALRYLWQKLDVLC